MLFRENNNPVVQNWMAKIGICKRRIRTSAEFSSRVLQLNLNYSEPADEIRCVFDDI